MPATVTRPTENGRAKRFDVETIFGQKFHATACATNSMTESGSPSGSTPGAMTAMVTPFSQGEVDYLLGPCCRQRRSTPL